MTRQEPGVKELTLTISIFVMREEKGVLAV